MLTRAFRPRTLDVSTSIADSHSPSRADSATDEVERYRRNERTATNKAPIDDASAVTDANNIVKVVNVIAALDHVGNLWTSQGPVGSRSG